MSRKFKILEYGMEIKEISECELDSFIKENGGNIEVCRDILNNGEMVHLNYTTIQEVLK